MARHGVVYYDVTRAQSLSSTDPDLPRPSVSLARNKLWFRRDVLSFFCVEIGTRLRRRPDASGLDGARVTGLKSPTSTVSG
jgi:hypothetical protein